MTAQIRELRVRLKALLAAERLVRTVDVRVLLQAGCGGKALVTEHASVTAALVTVLLSNVSLKVTLIGELLATVITIEFAARWRATCTLAENR